VSQHVLDPPRACWDRQPLESSGTPGYHASLKADDKSAAVEISDVALDIEYNLDSLTEKYSKGYGQSLNRPGNSMTSRPPELATDETLARGKSTVTSWRPFFLKRLTLFMILAVFVLELAGIITLYCYSERNGGILQVPAKNHQLWKYGPTACISRPSCDNQSCHS
jgi:hypothetical protein